MGYRWTPTRATQTLRTSSHDHLGVAVVMHSVLSQMLYARLFVSIPAAADQLRRGAELMYYGGDISEILLAFALVTTWHPVRKWTQSSSGKRLQAKSA